MCTVLVTYDPQNKIAKGLMDVLAITKGVEIKEEHAVENTVLNPDRKRIPVSEVYFEKGMYKELATDPFNLK